MAGVIGIASLSKTGLMPSGLYSTPTIKNIDAGASINLGSINGFLLVRDSYSWAGYNVFWCTHTQVSLLAGYESGQRFTVAYDSSVGGFTLTNNSDRRRGYGLIYQNISIPG